ncbi:MAG: sulfotransferase domain-containing protein, partial [Marivivens sp.]
HLFHYADMKADLDGTVARFARILGMDENDPLVDQIVQDTSFASLKKKAVEGDKSVEEEGSYLSAKFFDSGTSNKWVGQLSDDQLAAFDARMKALLPDDQAAWLLWGNKGRP